jgi:type II secretory pathway component GspD/PulD (secretin)
VKRPDKPPEKPNSDELKAEVGEDGLISFNFRYQAWPDVLDWLSRVSNMSLDWQELPTGFLNLTTQRPYTVEQTRDLINRNLLLRGFTMLENDDLLSVSKIASLDVGMIPRISTRELAAFAKRRPHAFVKVSFELDWMLAAEAVEELKPMLSPNHKLSALSKTNRLEAVDAATNLRDVLILLNQEQSDVGQEQLVKQFVLEYVRASEVKTQLEELLGMESKSAAGGGGSARGNSQQMRQMQQMRQQMQQMQQQARKQKKGAPAPKTEAKVYLIVNHRKNSILANAPPDKMAIISQAVDALDVKSNRADSLLDRRYQIQIYRLRSMDPTALVKTLEDLGDLDPVTRLEADTSNKSIIVYGSVLDHAMISQLLKRLDGMTRKFEVVRLRKAWPMLGPNKLNLPKVEKDEQPRKTDLPRAKTTTEPQQAPVPRPVQFSFS